MWNESNNDLMNSFTLSPLLAQSCLLKGADVRYEREAGKGEKAALRRLSSGWSGAAFTVQSNRSCED